MIVAHGEHGVRLGASEKTLRRSSPNTQTRVQPNTRQTVGLLPNTAEHHGKTAAEHAEHAEHNRILEIPESRQPVYYY